MDSQPIRAAIRLGRSPKVVQDRLGHSSAKTTLDVYGHLFADGEDRTRAAIDAGFGVRDVHQMCTSRVA